MRVFIGLKEIANVVFIYAKGFEALGHKTRTVVWSRNPLYTTSKYDVVIDDIIGPADPQHLSDKWHGIWRAFYLIERFAIVTLQFLLALVTCDTFVFVWGTSFFPRCWDYAILKLFRKRIISQFCGTDIRYWYAFEQESLMSGREGEVKPFVEYLRHFAYSQPTPPFSLIFKPYIDFTPHRPDDFLIMKMSTVRAAEKHANLIISKPDMGQLQTRSYMHYLHPLDLSQYRFHLPNKRVPLVLHVPSHRGVKGTEFVFEAVEKLRHEGLPFEFRLVEDTPNEVVRDLLSQSDIVVDQLFLGTFATLALEALASGNVVLARHLPDRERIPPGCPVINVTSDTLVDRLREVILDENLRAKLAVAGRQYAEKYFDHVRVVEQILRQLDNGENGSRYAPTFYSSGFVMPEELLNRETEMILREENKWLLPLSKRILRKRLNDLRGDEPSGSINIESPFIRD